jgi:hypothetical protein
MKESQFKTYLAAADTIDDNYSVGYQHGLRRHYHGDNFQVPGGLDAWRALDDDRGEGFRDGESGRPPRGFHGNIGNLNAAGDLPADSQLQVRVNSQVKARWVKQSQIEGLKLSQWVHKTLDDACE